MKLRTLLGQVRHRRAYYWCKHCEAGWFPTDDELGLLGKLTPAVQQVVTMAGGLSAAFKEGSEQVLHTMSGVLSESTVQRTTEKIGQEMSAGDPVAPDAEWDWHRDAEGRRCAYMSMGKPPAASGSGPPELRSTVDVDHTFGQGHVADSKW